MFGNLKKAMHAVAHGLGCDVVRYSPYYFYRLRRIQIMKHVGIDLVLDVGANSGQYAGDIRRDGFEGKIVSFEPVAASFEALSRASAMDPQWHVIRTAVGGHDGEIEIKVGECSTCSSILPVRNELTRVAPHARQVRVERVPITRLDTVAESVFGKAEKPWLKIDVQGYEKQVLEGLAARIKRVLCIEAELSLRPLYDGEADFGDMLAWLASRDFEFVSLGTGEVDQTTGFVLQIDGIFVRRGVA